MSNDAYIELFKKVLVDYYRVDFEQYKPLYYTGPSLKLKFLRRIDKILRGGKMAKNKYAICKIEHSDLELRTVGKDWPNCADSMIGLKRLDNIEYCVKQVIRENVPGDLIETGVWRGGATIFMKALLKDANITDRIVWVADSFEGLPKPDGEKYAADKGDKHYEKEELAISLEKVQDNFRRYGLLDDQVKFLKGWFKDTLPVAPIEKLAILRLDGDMYESTMDALVSLYRKVSLGGFIIVDDWGAVPACKQAIIDFRTVNNIEEEIIPIDWAGVYWRKTN